MRPYTTAPNPTGKQPSWVLPQAAAAALRGKTNNIVDYTLTQSSTTTVVNSPLITAQSAIIPVPLTANAAAALVGYYWSARADGTATLTHTLNANANLDVIFVVWG